jgi:DNA gyrase subunit A
VRGIKLNDGDAVCCAYPISKDTQYIISVTNTGLFKKTPISEFTVQGKNTKGAKIHKLNDGDWMADFISLANETEILVASTRSTIKISINDVPTLSRVTQGAKAIKMNDADKIIGISLY